MQRERLRALAVIALVLGALGVTAAAAETDYDRGKRSWLAWQYQPAYESLRAFRTQPTGRRPEVDYMLGTSGCRLAGLRPWGFGVLDWMLYAYPLTGGSRTLVMYERDLCRAAGTTLAAARVDPMLLNPVVSAGMTARGKLFYQIDTAVPVASYPARRIREMPPGTFEARLKPREALDQAATETGRRVPGFRVVGLSRFVIATSAGQSIDSLRDVATTLDRYLTFLQRRYGIAEPSHLITIYLAPDPGGLRKLASEVHGLDVSPATLGYAFRDDASVAALVPGDAYGTLLHELFHLVVRDSFGDIPQWLDEGIAGLYEVSSVTGDEVRGEANWRGDVLEHLWSLRPSVEAMIRSEWFPFDVPEGERGDLEGSRTAAQQAAYFAMARYFALYLQEQGKLPDVFASVRDRDLSAVAVDARAQAVTLVEGTLGKRIATVDEEFQRWFEQVQRSGLPHAEGGVPIRKYTPEVRR